MDCRDPDEDFAGEKMEFLLLSSCSYAGPWKMLPVDGGEGEGTGGAGPNSPDVLRSLFISLAETHTPMENSNSRAMCGIILDLTLSIMVEECFYCVVGQTVKREEVSRSVCWSCGQKVSADSSSQKKSSNAQRARDSFKSTTHNVTPFSLFSSKTKKAEVSR